MLSKFLTLSFSNNKCILREISSRSYLRDLTDQTKKAGSFEFFVGLRGSELGEVFESNFNKEMTPSVAAYRKALNLSRAGSNRTRSCVSVNEEENEI